MERNSKQLTARLIELRKAIKRKYKMFKDGVAESDVMLEKQYKPIIEELRKSEKRTEPIKDEPKDEPMDYGLTDDDDNFEPETVSTPEARQLSESSHTMSTTDLLEENFKNPITQEYMSLFLKDTNNSKIIDYSFGPRYENGTTLMIGDKELDFDKSGNILIDDVNYGASVGLYELLFKRVPDDNTYSAEDLKTYKSILFTTNAHREGYRADGKIKSNRSTKYMRIIKTLFPASVRGKGRAVWKSVQSRDIVHWDDVNELVDRLLHITMSAESGNSVHTNEFISIIEELREAGFIKGQGNSRFKSLLK